MRLKIREWVLPLTSLAVALSALFYNTWRNEKSEQNRNVRAAGFEIIKELSALQLIADFAHYEQDSLRGNAIAGWSQILLIDDLAMVMPSNVQMQAKQLHEHWGAHAQSLGENTKDNEIIVDAIAKTRQLVILSLKDLH